MTATASLSPAVRALEAAYDAIRAVYPDAPAATIVVKRDNKAWGHTTVGQVWHARTESTPDHYEIMVSGENLARSTEQAFATLLHEAAHARNLANGRRDCDVNGRHNRVFKSTAEEHGLACAQVGSIGWSDTSLTDDGRARWAETIAALDAGLNGAAASSRSVAGLPGWVLVPPSTSRVNVGRALLWPGADHSIRPSTSAGPRPIGPARRTGNRNLVKAVCACGDSIRASQGVLDRCAPTCSACDEPFVAVGR